VTADGPDLVVPGAGVRLVFVRHGETPSNVRHLLDTLPPGPGLTAKGLRQADGLPDRLAEEKIQAVYASVSLRAQQTALPLATRHDLPVAVADGTHEIYVGELEGSGDAASRQQFEDIYARWHFGELDQPMPGGETGRQALSRFLAAARQAVEGAVAGSVVMVSHGAMLRLVAAHLSSNVDSARAQATNLPNTGVIVLEPAPSMSTGWRCVQWDDLLPE
jgi:broad specificity phosphatase PhoE